MTLVPNKYTSENTDRKSCVTYQTTMLICPRSSSSDRSVNK